jgi:tetratricopeptide (TPR) repeat protein
MVNALAYCRSLRASVRARPLRLAQLAGCLLIAAALSLAGCERAAVPAPAAPVGTQAAPKLEGVGRSDFAVTTTSPAARAFFNQGLSLAFAFDHGEARRAFAEALRLDPACAICAWGLSYVTGPYVNRPERGDLVATRAHIQRALQLAATASERERALIRAQAIRVGVDPSLPVPAAAAKASDVPLPPGVICVTRVPRDADPADVAYAQAMARVAFDHPDDADLGVLHAEALLMLSPWDWWSTQGEPRDGTREAIAELERVLARAPAHAGALHYLIHAYEQSPTPAKAIDAAQRLPALAPHAGHLVHMPAHIWMRLGRYADATAANEAAVDADAALAAQMRAQGFAPLAQPTHHFHFLWASAALQGAGAVAIGAADEVAAVAAAGDSSYGGGNDYFLALPLFARVRFARWDEIEATPAPAGASVYPRAIWHWARGVSQARRGDAAAAERELAALRALVDDPSLEGRLFKGIDELRAFLRIAEASLEGDVRAARRQWPQAIAALARAVELERALESEEPPPWALSTQVELAGVQLLAGRAQDAERSAQADLARHPANGWALYVLAESLKRQGRLQEAQRVRAQFAAAWTSADLARPDARY